MCLTCQCEKISTLGDCYYCVSGCPEPRVDHASNCVEMGLSMIKAIKDFDDDCNESVNMRVGIHTGTVLCGIVGKKRFKFDVWSNDVNLANRMESMGKPGMVHISDKTYQFLKEEYYVQQAEDFQDMSTYFITGRKSTSVYHLKAENQVVESPSNNSAIGSLTNSTDCYKEMRPITRPKSEPNGTKSLPVLDEQLKEEGGRVIMNKLHRFLRQRSAPGSVPPSNGVPAEMQSGEESHSEVIESRHNGVAGGTPLSKTNGSTSLRKTASDLQPTHKSTPDTKPLCPLASMALEFEIVPGQQTPTLWGETGEERSSKGGLVSQSSLASLADINNVLCNTSKSSINENDIALTFQEIESQAASLQQSLGRGGLTESISRFHQLRKKSDLVLIRSVQEDTAHHRYFTRPPLHNISCFFLDPGVESEYRKTAWKSNHRVGEYEQQPTLASSSINAYIDILVSGIVFLVVSLACLARYGPGLVWLSVAGMAGLYQLLVVAVCPRHLFSSTVPARSHRFRTLYSWCRGWYPTQFFGAILIALPVITLLANLTCNNLSVTSEASRNYYLNLLTVCLIHFCNFTQIYCYVKSVLATLFAVSLVIFQAIPQGCPCSDDVGSSHPSHFTNATHTQASPFLLPCSSSRRYLTVELSLVITSLLLLVWMLNREFEINYRLSYHCSLLAAKDRKRILNLKNQADWLLHNIIPDHVSDQLKKSAKYSENHREVGIVFASLVNFNELYDESYMGGKEFLRVLNELISDFDELLDQSEFRNVEKIKTIGATFMAASGLNPFIRERNSHKYQHLNELMEFAFALERSVEDFNQSLIEFDLILRIGLNHGDVTSGVIGTTKLYYDIWGDAVNIASRMDSTGVEGRIQVNQRTKDVLSQWFEFEERGEIFVKGKDNMKVFLFTQKKEDA